MGRIYWYMKMLRFLGHPEAPMVGDADHPSDSLPSIRDVFPDQFPAPSAQAASIENPQSGTQQPPPEAAPSSAQEEAYAKRKYVCETCHKRFLRPSSLRAHLVVHTGDRPYPCPYPGCTKRFTSKSNMKRHRQTHGSAASDAAPAAGPSTAPGALDTVAAQASSSSSTSPSAGHFGVLNLDQLHPSHSPGAAGQQRNTNP
ncbi:uncharacterized protein PHACADRAFT_112932 [Phanerochaete carnosa HHB-10118-sp]|uniref:C2H2-type domain-containing protein n=1 Tax=Phanerochaete carnosa (strain HHB-10118-sp) TaxID=650164 RepID=K5X7L5_PHACS|nr:uncharacterized protein PHACADRAFT_112932 [Phanerochaete carnosa HHB-10118-sp]EKM58822.1 hypothetical protein PHACADRAFT_112932 [Phanerochaete carnosa HHB-10118-sp]